MTFDVGACICLENVPIETFKINMVLKLPTLK